VPWRGKKAVGEKLLGSYPFYIANERSDLFEHALLCYRAHGVAYFKKRR
jgi:hypothetical protein